MTLKGGKLDFYTIKHKTPKKGVIEVFPDFKHIRSKDIMVRSKTFYAIWDEDTGLWSTDIYKVQEIIDQDLELYRRAVENRRGDYDSLRVSYLLDASTRSWSKFLDYMHDSPDNFVPLDQELTFANDDVRKDNYISKKLPYPLLEGPYEAWEELISTLYNPEDRAKLEWAIGSIVAGEAKNIQKFVVIYGEAGAGKSTILNVIQKLFIGYYTTFEANAITDNKNSFATEMFKDNPLVAIQHDGNLSKILDNSKLNSIVSHEEITINEKFKSEYVSRVNAMLFMGTNQPVKISDAKSGLIRRLIDVRTSGRKVPVRRYQTLMSQIDFELGAIAFHCLDVYRTLGKEYYSSYKPLEMMFETDFFINFVEDNYYIFRDSEYITLTQAFDMYKEYCEDSKVDVRLPKYKFRTELLNYFEEFRPATHIDGKYVRSVYSGFKKEAFISSNTPKEIEAPMSLILDSTDSIFDAEMEDQPAQYAVNNIPGNKWSRTKTKLKDLDTSKLHYVKVPRNHIVIDFDLKDEAGNKSAELNLEAASKWPPTYAEYSQSQKGLHLHYIYDGDPETLSRIYSDGIEIKVSVGDASIRRALSKCNHVPIAHLNSGLPLKGKRMIDFDQVKSEKGLRDLVKRNLRKEIHPGTKPSMDFIHKILEDAYESGLKYDLTQLRPTVLSFAANSTNQSEYCVKLVSKMKFKSEDTEEEEKQEVPKDFQLVFFDVEVFSNLLVVCWKYQGRENKCVRMINPTPSEIEELLKLNLIGFNCRRYDNHILYARYIGYTNEQLFEISSRIVSNDSSNGYFREAYNLSYADVYDFSSKKQSLKAFEIELGIHHQELNIPWDKPVPEEQWEQVAEYCENDVVATEVVFEDRKQDWIARQILADLSGLSLNATTKAHTAKIIFGNDPKPSDSFVYTDLSTMFPGYRFDAGKSTYRDEIVGEGGYVYAEPGMYENVALLDVASMHPASILALNLFGKYTSRYKELLDARLAIKHKDYNKAKTMLGGLLNKYLDNPEDAAALAYALKIHALNIVYGLTSAKFSNPFKDDRNKDNIVAKRGALFMIDLKHALQDRGIPVIHIKTDSVKIPNATPSQIAFVTEFGKKYGYTFEHEATYSKFCLVNNAVYVAKKQDGKWTATGTEFIHPYVFKSLFSKEEILFEDMCETKAVTGGSYIYLDMNEGLKEGEHNYQFIGKVGSFCPIKSGFGGGILYRVKDNKHYAVTGTKGFRWLEATLVKSLNKTDDIDVNYHRGLVDGALAHISEFGDPEWLLSED